MDTREHLENIVVLFTAAFMVTLVTLLVFSIIEENTQQVAQTVKMSGDEAADIFHILNREGEFGEQKLESLRNDIRVEDGWNIYRDISKVKGNQLSVPGKRPSPETPNRWSTYRLFNEFNVPVFNPGTNSFYNLTIYQNYSTVSDTSNRGRY